MPAIDLLFPAQGGPFPLDHGYLLFSALSARIPELHARRDVGVFHLRGPANDGENLHLGRKGGTLRIRCPAEAIPLLLPLAGSRLQLAGQGLVLGAPNVRALQTEHALGARLVTFKHALIEEAFLATARRHLDEMLGPVGTLHVGRRRILTISGSKVVGFALGVEHLSPDASLTLQEQGLGGRRHMGCGLFLPTRVSLRAKAAA